jgi:NTP pyrophosphatase (non-canonical NTP hydrolase)
MTTQPKVLNLLAREIAAYREGKGFVTSWENMPEKLCLVHSEVSEALEGYRKDDRANFAEEIADTIIRCLDITGSLGIDIEAEIQNKMERNRNREYRHGGKRC